jgi:hypothetical protein
LTLQKNEIRRNNHLNGSYEKDTEAEDDRFFINFAVTESIATSHGQNDSGMFELNFRDERRIKFEGAGVISRWRIHLPVKYRQFDYNTISDVILHLKYTAREGGNLLKDKAIENLDNFVKAAAEESQKHGLYRAFNIKHEFSNEWYRFKTGSNGNQHDLDIKDLQERFPFFAQNVKLIKNILVEEFYLIADMKFANDPKIIKKESEDTESEILTFSLGGKIGSLTEYKETGQELPIDDWTVRVEDDIQNLSQMWLVLRYKLELNE